MGEITGDLQARAAGYSSYQDYLKQGGGSSGGFSFDYAAEAEKAYGDLGPYYLRLLTESKGDVNKAISRLTQDYDTGIRQHRADTAFQEQGLSIQRQNTTQAVQNNALSRGLYQKSLFDQGGGMGIPDTNLQQQMVPLDRAQQQLSTGLQRYLEGADLQKTRTTEDINDKQKKYEADLERQRRLEAGTLANERGSRAYQKYQAENLLSPTYA